MTLQEKPMTWLRTKAFCGCLVLLALSACNREGQQQPDPAPPRRVTVRPVYQGLDAATVAAYEKLGATYGTMPTGYVPFRPGLDQPETYKFQFRAGRNPAEKGLPGFRFRFIPQAKLPEVAAPFGLHLGVPPSSGVAEARLKELAGLPNLVALNLDVAQDAGLKELAGCKNLSALSLFDARFVTNAGLKELAGCKNLNTLNLFDAQGVTDAGLKALAGCKNLSELNLTQARVTDRGLKELASLPNLTTFSLVYNQPDITTAGLKELAGCKNLAELSLSLANSRGSPGSLKELSPVSLKELAGFKSLAKLDLYWPPIDATLIGLADLNILTTLHLEGRAFSDESLHVLRGMGLLHTLSVAQGKDGARPRSAEEVISLDLSGALWVTDEGLKALAGLKNLTSLKLSGRGVATEPPLKELAVLDQLRTLDLSNFHVTGAGLKQLAGLKNLTSLKLNVSLETPALLKELAALKNLTALDLTLNHPLRADVGLMGLAALKNLTSLKLRGSVTRAGVEQLREQLPGCQIQIMLN
jgi:hypothetical protein